MHQDGTSEPATARFDIKLFGQPHIAFAGRRLAMPDRAFALVAYLTLQPGRRAKRTDIAHLFWGEAGSERSQANLRQFLVRLRKFQEDHGLRLFEAGDDSIGLGSRPGQIDLSGFAGDAIGVALRREDGGYLLGLALSAGSHLLEGLEGAGLHFEEWLKARRQELRERLLDAATTALETPGFFTDEHSRASLAQCLFDLDPTHEPACRALMDSLAAKGERSAALRVFARCEAALSADLGIKPEAATAGRAAALRSLQPSLQVMTQTPEPQPQLLRAPGAGAPRLVILPPVSLSADENVNRFAAVLIEDVTVRLSRYRSFAVIAAHTASALASSRWDGQGHRIDYAVNSGVKPSSTGVAMTFRLTDGQTGEVKWVSEIAWRPDMLAEIFDHLVGRVVGSMVDALERNAMQAPAASTGASAYRLYLEGQQKLRSMDLPDLRRARAWFREAAKNSEHYAPPLVGMARSLFMEWLVRGMKDPAMLANSQAFSNRALTLDPFDWRALRERGMSRLYMRRHDDSSRISKRRSCSAPTMQTCLPTMPTRLPSAAIRRKGF